MRWLAFVVVAGIVSCKSVSRPSPAPSASSASPAPSGVTVAKPEPKARAKGPRLLELGVPITKTYEEKRRPWRQVQEVNWQRIAEGEALLPTETKRENGTCEAGMLPVKGGLLLDPKGRDDNDEVLLLQNRACTHFLTANHGVSSLCDRFDREKWLELSRELPRKQLEFCIDRYEFPNSYGEYPLVVVTYSESKKYCEKVGKRVCTESEWTLACEGEEGRPYPYGYERDETACRIGILAAGPGKDTFRPRTLPHTARGIDFAWQGKRSGESPRCVSPFGVEDMTGNVDEWTKNVRRYGYEMIMKGGHWGPARQRCRPQTRGHGPYYVRYDQGFRCCK
jgi:sulfatase modifying factor 1